MATPASANRLMEGAPAPGRGARLREWIRPTRVAGLSAAAALLLGIAAGLVSPGDALDGGLELTLRDASGREWLRRPWPEASLEALASRIPPGGEEAGPLTARLEGLWRVVDGGPGELWLKADGEAAWWQDGREVLRRPAASGSRSARLATALPPGWHPVALELRLPRADTTFAKIQWAPDGDSPRDLSEEDLFRSAPDPGRLARRSAARWLAGAALSTVAAGALLLGLLAFGARRRTGVWPSWWAYAWVPALLLVVAGALRFEAVVGQYWHVDAPGWAREAARLISTLRPDAPRWGPQADPYRGDPWGYLQAAREPRGLYTAHVREPVFVLATKAILPLVDGHDVAVNLASAGFSALAVVATYALGLRAFSLGVGFWAALLLALERRVVALGIQGWRDDAFTFFTVLTALALVELMRRSSAWSAAMTGVAGGLACLTRITSLSFLLPGLAWLARPPFEGRRLRWAGVALAVAIGILAPYLIACQLAFGDPLYAINYHTGFYRARQGVSPDAAMSVDAWLASGDAPLATLDTLVVGLTHYPFANKWQHFEWIAPGLGAALAAAALVGLALFLGHPAGRLLVVVLLGALLPYAFTWRIPGGGEWRFTLHAYPFYLLAAAFGVSTAVSAVRPSALAGLPGRVRGLPRRRVAAGVAAVAGVGLVWGGLAGLLYLKSAEADRLGRSWRVEAGPRDGFFFGSGWSWPVGVGRHWQRDTRGEPAVLFLPLQPGRDHDLTLRMGLREPAAVQTATVSLNGTRVTDLPLRFQPERLGVHSVRLSGGRVRSGRNRLEIRTGPAAATLWYVHVAPAGVGDGADGAAGRDEAER